MFIPVYKGETLQSLVIAECTKHPSNANTMIKPNVLTWEPSFTDTVDAITMNLKDLPVEKITFVCDLQLHAPGITWIR